jgi:hypothetical protein
MNLLSRTLPEGNQNHSSADTHSSPMSLGVKTSGDSVAASSSLDLDFLIGQDVKTGSSETTGGPGRGGGGSDGGGGGGSLGRSSTSSDLLNGMFVSLLESMHSEVLQDITVMHETVLPLVIIM